jgi:hypothetical protein
LKRFQFDYYLCALALISLPAAAQSPKIIDFNPHGWVSYSGDHDIKGKWGIHFDAQWRRSDFFTEWQQYQLRPGLNYRRNRNQLFTLGYVFTKAYPYGDFPVIQAFPEHRTYQQALLRQDRGAVILQHRIRLEQRWIQYPTNPGKSYTYQNRFRYLLKADFPITRTRSGSAKWYLPVYNEFLIGFAPNYGARPWDQNRLFGGIGYNTGPAGNVEIGFLNQFLGQRNGRIFEFNNTLFVTFTSNYSLAHLFGR